MAQEQDRELDGKVDQERIFHIPDKIRVWETFEAFDLTGKLIKRTQVLISVPFRR
jgi:hypothetical protein